jgi:hypothetical protein
MATDVVTLEFGGVEKSLADWGFDQDSPVLEVKPSALDVLTLTVPGVSIIADPIIDFEAIVILRLGRTGSGTSYSSGWTEFRGKRMLTVLDGRPEFEGVIYQFGGPWYDIDQTPFQQSLLVYTGPLVTDVVTVLNSDTVLFQKMTAPGVIALRNNGQQITDVLQHVLDMYTAQSMTAPFQIGTIGVAVALNTYPVKDIKCSEAIQICLRSSPDANVWFDYTTNPPTLNVTKRADATPVSLAIKNGTNHKSLRITPRPDLQARAVCLYFKQTSDANGQTWITNTKQKYPGGGEEGGLRVIVQTIDLQGGSRTDVFGELKCTPCDCNNASQSNRRTWWGKYNPALQDGARITSVTINTATIIEDDTGSALSLGTYPNVLDGGGVAAWMKLSSGTSVAAKRATIVATCSYTRVNTVDGGSEKVRDAILTAKVELTNGVTGSYSALANAVAAESIASGLAQSIYDSLNLLQYEGQDVRVEGAMSQLISLGNVLNLTGGRTEWTTMKAQIQSIRRVYGWGYTEIAIGPARHLSAGDLTALFLVNRLRRMYTNPAAQASAQPTGGDNSVKMPKELAKENGGMEVVGRALLEVNKLASGTTTSISHDAENQWIKMTVSSGATPSILMDLPTLGARSATWQWLYFRDADDSCAPKKMLVLGTPPEAA